MTAQEAPTSRPVLNRLPRLGALRFSPSARIFPQRPGFTLIEVLVVITIISVLLTMLLPSMRSSQTLARVVTCESNKHQCYMAMSAYVADYKGRYPNQGMSVSTYSATVWGAARFHSEQQPQQADPTQRYYAWGALYSKRYFDDGKMLYCNDNPLTLTPTYGGISWIGYRNASAPWIRSNGIADLDTASYAVSNGRWPISGVAWSSPWYLDNTTGSNIIGTSWAMPFNKACQADLRPTNLPLFADMAFVGQSWVAIASAPVPHDNLGVVLAANDGRVLLLRNPNLALSSFGAGHPWETQPQGQGLGISTTVFSPLP